MPSEVAREAIRKSIARQLRPEFIVRGQTNRYPLQDETRQTSLQHHTNRCKYINTKYRVPSTTSYLSSIDYPSASHRSYTSAASVSTIHQTLRKLRESANMSGLMGNLDIMKEADAFPYLENEPKAFKVLNDTLYTLVWKDGQPLGYMLDSVLKQLLATPEKVRGPVMVDNARRTVRAFELPTEAERTARVSGLMQYWRENRTFDILRGWRDELWPVYGSADEVLYSVERSGTGLLGITRYGVHMTGFVKDEAASHGMKILVAQRAADKSTYPNMLDNSVAGGLMTGEHYFECIVREAQEEAGLPEALMRERAEPVGMVTYIYITDERAGGEAGQIYPETQWVYDMELPASFTPTPTDGEVAAFYLWTVEEVREKLAKGLFKPNCALILVDFFIRHNIVTPENEPDFDEIVRRLHRKLPFPGPHQVGRSTMEKFL
ncbi:NUDIX hydrolase domain-like protein [Jackrogersella minutella]|nr:NUDIX hydrolase domain-like protein [Jackrogersella minutella]